MKHKLLEPTDPPSNYSTLSDKEKNSRMLAYLCQYVEDKAVGGSLSDRDIKVIEATAKLMGISVSFSSNNSIDITMNIKALMGDDEK